MGHRFLLCTLAAFALCVASGVSAQQSQAVGAPAPAVQPTAVQPTAAPPMLRLVDRAARIERLIAQGAMDEATAVAREFMQSVGEQTGFGVTNIQLTEGDAPNFGVFQPRGSGVYAIGEPVHVYVELYGFSLQPAPGLANRMVFDVEFTVHDEQGQQLTDRLVSMGEVVLNTYSRPLDGFINLTYRITGVTGAVTLRTQITDRASGQMAEFTVPVTFASPQRALSPDTNK